MLTRYDFFYDAQVKRYLTQMVRAFSGFQYMTGDRGDGKPASLRMVPCIPARRNRQVAAIQRNMSENTLLSVPMISVDITGLEPDRERMQSINHVDTVHVTERAKDSVTGEYTSERGNTATIDRLMPRPFTITFQVDIWTSNMDQKFMLIEQIACMVFPGFDIQNSDNAIDWSALTTATLEALNYSSVSVPIGTENEIDVATFTFKVPMWLSPPAKVTRQNLIKDVITNVNDATMDANDNLIPSGQLLQNITTPGNYCVRVERGTLTLLGPSGQEFDPNGQPYSWEALLAEYGTRLYPSVTKVRLLTNVEDDASNDVVGSLFPTDNANEVQWQPDIDTLPANTLVPLTGIIDPIKSVPGEGVMPALAEGQRYLLINNDLAGPSLAWGAISARVGSIIQYRDGAWVVAFSATDHDRIEYVTNRNTGRQLVWNVEQQSWVMALDGVYAPGYFKIQ